MSKITGGEIKYGRTVKTGDFENKRVDVALTFSVEDGEDHSEIIQVVAKEAHDKAHAMLGIKVTPATPASTTEVAGAAAVMMATATGNKEVAAAAMNAREKAKAEKAPKPEKVASPSPAQPADKSSPAEDFGDVFDEDAPESQPEITDAAMSAAMNKKVGELKAVHAGAAPKHIKELIGKFVEPPKKAHDIPQNLRAEFLKKLDALK